jgi:aminopeptidase N
VKFRWVRGAAAFATGNQVSWLKGLLDGSIQLPGLQMDTDLRWEILAGLATLGELSVDSLDLELQRDNTASGQKAHALAKAAIPDEKNKAQVWEELVEQDNMSNSILESASRGFTRVSDAEVLAPYVDKYLKSAERIWEEKSFSIAEYLLLNLYPIELANQELRDKTAELMTKQSIQDKPALRRILIEHLANLDRALACQKRMES